MEKSQGLEVNKLENYGVGGYFHFTYQTANNEYRQYPAVYVLSEADYSTRTIYHHIYRIAFAEASLVVDCPITNERRIIIDSSVWPKIEQFNEEGVDDYKKRINKIIEQQPFYNFCRFGFINPSRRNSFGMHVTNQEDYVVNKNGEINEHHKRLIAENFS